MYINSTTGAIVVLFVNPFLKVNEAKLCNLSAE